MSAAYGENAEKVYQFAPRADDVWLVTFPKCGNYIQCVLQERKETFESMNSNRYNMDF